MVPSTEELTLAGDDMHKPVPVEGFGTAGGQLLFRRAGRGIEEDFLEEVTLSQTLNTLQGLARRQGSGRETGQRGVRAARCRGGRGKREHLGEHQARARPARDLGQEF